MRVLVHEGTLLQNNKMKFHQVFFSVLCLFITTSSWANIVGSDLENFNPTTDGLGYVTVESAEILDTGRFNLGAFLDYSYNILPMPKGTNVTPDDRLLTSNLHMAVGLMKGWSIGGSITSLVSESTNQTSFAAQFTNKGQEAIRLDSKVRLIHKKDSSLAALIAVNLNRINNNPYLGQDPGPSFMVGAAYEEFISQTLRWALNISYRSRSTGGRVPGFVIEPLGDQLLYSAGVHWNMESWKTRFIGELYGAYVLDEPTNNTDREQSILEALVGARWSLRKNIDFHFGLTRGVYAGVSTPDIRYYGGLNWYFGPLWGKSSPAETIDEDSDGDGVFDSRDECPDTPYGVRVNKKGCERKKKVLIDSDNDGIADDDDLCPGTEYGIEVNAVGCPMESMVVNEPLDSDGDGVPNDYDLCPDTQPGVKVTERGCEKKRIRKFDLGKLNFISGTDRLTKNSRIRFMKKIDKLYKIRKKIKKVYIEGHTDNVGKAGYNKKLSRKRAQTIKRILVKQARISSKKIVARGYGETRPIRSNKTKKGRLINRRVEMNLIMK